MSEEAKEGALEQASTALSLASNAAKQRNRALRVMIEVEAGALHGAWHMELRKAGKSADALRRQINDLLEHVDRARSLDPMSFYPVDVLTWGVIDALEADTLPPDQAGELLAYMLGAFDTIEPKALPAGQAEQCAKRSADVAIFLRDANWLKRSLDALEEMGSAAGVYLIARRLLGKLPSRYPASAEQLDAIHRTRLYLEAHSTTWKHDARCALLHLKLWWLEKVGVPWFYSERMVVPFERELWAECYELLERLADIQTKGGSAEPSPTVQYLTGIALFHLGAYAPGSEQFERLASVSDLVLGKHRIVRYYLLGTADGSPVTFDGTVARVLPDGRKGLIELKGMGRAIPFFVRDFGREVRPGETLGDVNVAFNHLGPLAEQSYRYRKPAEQDVYSDRND
jgi:hypothetical protein